MEQKPGPGRIQMIGAILGGVLLGLIILWLGWSLFLSPTASTGSAWKFFRVGTSASPVVQQAPLLAAGITLGRAEQKPVLSQAQALLLAGQQEPDAASQAQNTQAQYVLVNYPAKDGNHADIKDQPSWLIIYQKIPLQPTDAEVDPTPFPQSTHDLYLFLDASTGHEILSVWI
ncbi:hypothetical protein [Tengunoibacter tsumagoiensis]|uniref:Uncharacterized protein n=1 Tax=Tengunoibacter tsumagoiensis TaxID=2014871 RepID=A0A401ZXV3_9CHLR|nr:hypothetical protein [Tengunoibacter tsumagoiensis]GCE11698.1 hypothetical protein KTT_15570 [Tengunoibacter tsumagoiensis]